MSQRTSERPWLSELLAGMAMATGIGYLAGAYSVSRWLTRPARGRPQATPGDFGLPWEPLDCVTADRQRLVGWALSPPRPRATVVLFHGIRNNREQTLGRSVLLAAQGYRCVAFDHRAHGESSGRRSSFGYHESRDVKAVLDLVCQRWPKQPRAVLGISMGAAALCYAAPHVKQCRAVILESCYHDIATAFAYRLRHGYPPWFQRLSRGIIWVTERRLGLRLGQLTPAEHIGALETAPILLLTGANDPHAPPHDAERLYQRCRGPRELWLVPRASHLNLFETAGPTYSERVLTFLDRCLATESVGGSKR